MYYYYIYSLRKLSSSFLWTLALQLKKLKVKKNLCKNIFVLVKKPWHATAHSKVQHKRKRQPWLKSAKSDCIRWGGLALIKTRVDYKICKRGNDWKWNDVNGFPTEPFGRGMIGKSRYICVKFVLGRTEAQRIYESKNILQF